MEDWKKRIRVIVGYNHADFREKCRQLGVAPRSVKYVNFRDINTGLAGYYQEDVYPIDFADSRPRRQDSD